MKKYAQITIILGLFFALVWWRGRTEHAGSLPVVGLPTTTPTATTPNTNTSSNNSTSPNNTSGQMMTGGQGMMMGKYKDGTYTGSVADAFYGNVQVRVTVSGGSITDVIFLQHPGDNGTSQRINSQAMPLLQQEALNAQSANIDGVSGASATSGAFIQSLSSALQQAA